MRSTQQLSATLPKEMAAVIKAKVAAGEYATESEVIRDWIQTLLARDRAVDQWLSREVGPAFDALERDLSRALSVSQVRAKLAAEREAFKVTTNS